MVNARLEALPQRWLSGAAASLIAFALVGVGFLFAQPLQFDGASKGVGSVADLLNVVVSAIVGWAVWLLGRRTHDIEKRLEDKEQREHETVRQLVLVALSSQVTKAKLQASQLLAETPSATFVQDYAGDISYRDRINGMLHDLRLPAIEEHWDRLALVGNPDAARFLRVNAVISALADDQPSSPTDAAKLLQRGLKLYLPGLVKDIEQLHTTCAEAVTSAGLRTDNR